MNITDVLHKESYCVHVSYDFTDASGFDIHVGANWDNLKWHAERYLTRFRILTFFLPSLQGMNVIDFVINTQGGY